MWKNRQLFYPTKFWSYWSPGNEEIRQRKLGNAEDSAASSDNSDVKVQLCESFHNPYKVVKHIRHEIRKVINETWNQYMVHIEQKNPRDTK